MYDSDEFNELADKLVKNLKSPQGLSAMAKMLAKVAMEHFTR